MVTSPVAFPFESTPLWISMVEAVVVAEIVVTGDTVDGTIVCKLLTAVEAVMLAVVSREEMLLVAELPIEVDA